MHQTYYLQGNANIIHISANQQSINEEKILFVILPAEKIFTYQW